MVLADVGQRTQDFIDVSAIELNPDNPRGPNVLQHDRRFEELRESVAQFGVIVPLVVLELGEGKYRLIDGERRYHAAKALRIPKVPAIIVHEPMDSDRVRQTMFQIHTNWSQWDASMQCHALEGLYRELKKKHGDNERIVIRDIVAHTGADEGTTRNRVQFLRWPQKIKQGVYAGKHRGGYWYIVEIEDKIIEPAMKNFPEYFQVVKPSEVRTLLFRKLEEGLVKAAVQVRRAGIIARPVIAERRDVAVGILRRLADETDYSFEEARQDYLREFPEAEQEPPPSPRAVLTLVGKLKEALENLTLVQVESAHGRARVDRNELVKALGELEATLRDAMADLE